MDFDRAKTIAGILYQDSNGYSVSRIGKETAGLVEDKAFTYGEISFDTFPEILALSLSKGNPKPDNFYDLGSGTGKAVIIATLLGGFQKIRGIELIPELFKESNRILERFTTGIAPLMKTEEPVPDVAFVNDDFFRYDWSDADLVFVQGTCMPSDTMKHLTRKFEALKPGSKIIVVSSLLPSAILKHVATSNYKLGWGVATINFYERP